MGNLERRIEDLEHRADAQNPEALVIRMIPERANSYEEAIEGLNEPGRIVLCPEWIRRRARGEE
jgi:hypothetical protein